jgi:transposase
MMPTTRKSYPPTLKARVAVDAIRAEKTVTELAQLHSVHPNLVTEWKRQALEALPEVFRQSQGRKALLPTPRKTSCSSKSAGRLSVWKLSRSCNESPR